MTADVIYFNLEIALLSALFSGLYALRVRFGLSPLYVAVGVLLSFMAVGGRMRVMVYVVGGDYVAPAGLPGKALISVLDLKTSSWSSLDPVWI